MREWRRTPVRPDCGEPIPAARPKPQSGPIPTTRPPAARRRAADPLSAPRGRGEVGMAFNKTPHPEEAAKEAVSKDAPALVARLRRFEREIHRPNATATAPEPAFAAATSIALAPRPTRRTECPPGPTPP